MTRAELISLARRIMEADGTGEEIDQMSELFNRSVPHPSGINLAYFPENYGTSRDAPSEVDYHPTPEQVVDMCLHPRVLITPPPLANQAPKETITLPKRWSDFLLQQPETGMDYHVVSIMLDDGTRIEDVAIINASIVGEIRNQPNCTFDPEKIIKMEVTHHRWPFQR